MRRAAIYAREDPTAGAERRLDAQVGSLATFVRRHRWWHVATYADLGSAGTLDRSGLAQLIAGGRAGWFDLVVVERRETVALDAVARHYVRDQLAAADVATILMHPPIAARLGRAVAGLALVDLAEDW